MSPGSAPAPPRARRARLLKEAFVSLLVGGMAFLAWPIVEAVASATMAVRCAGWVATGVGLGAWRAAVAGLDAALGGATRAWSRRGAAAAAGGASRPRIRRPQP